MVDRLLVPSCICGLDKLIKFDIFAREGGQNINLRASARHHIHAAVVN